VTIYITAPRIALAMNRTISSYFVASCWPIGSRQLDNTRTAMKQNLKIAQIVPYYSPVIGGVEVVCKNISEELAERGHEVHVFTANRNHERSSHLHMPRDEIINGVNVHRFRSYFNVGHFGFFPGFISPLSTGRFDIIHAHCYRQPQSEISSRAGIRLNIPTILHLHGGFYTHSKRKRFLYTLFDSLARKHMVNRFDHFIVLSEGDQARLLELNVDRDNISIIRNAAENQAFDSVNPARFRKKHGLVGKRIILYLGILHHYKRPDLLIQTLPRLIAKEPEVFLLFVGPDAGELKKMRELGKQLGVTSHYKWIGPLQGEEKHAAIECAEFLALPSDEDPYPLVLLEAMAHKKPVLTTSVVGQAPVISANEAGIIFAPRDLNALVAGAIKLLTEPAYRTVTANKARLLAEKVFSEKAVVDEIEMLYRTLIRHK
jgi:glycosyltransferase involved in cell wall biosynthesis